MHELVTIETHALVLIGRAQDGVHTYDHVRWLCPMLRDAPPLERVP